MRIVLSKKGSDSSYGRIPSPVFIEKGKEPEIFSLPIPQGGIEDKTEHGNHYFQISDDKIKLRQYIDKVKKENCGLYHLDPDIRKELHSENYEGWFASLGQSGSVVKSALLNVNGEQNKGELLQVIKDGKEHTKDGLLETPNLQ